MPENGFGEDRGQPDASVSETGQRSHLIDRQLGFDQQLPILRIEGRDGVAEIAVRFRQCDLVDTIQRDQQIDMAAA